MGYVCVFSPKAINTSGIMWSLYDQLNKLYNFYIAAVIGILVGISLELKCIVEANLTRVN